MKKLVIAIAIIATAVTAKVGHSEYQEWHHEKFQITLHEIDAKFSQYDSERVNAQRWISYYTAASHKGFWRSIFNSFSK